jgi:hypothetical protein
MKQTILAMAGDQTFENYRKPTRREEFLKTMQTIVPWSALCEVIEPHDPKAGNAQPPIGLERMLRIHYMTSMRCLICCTLRSSVSTATRPMPVRRTGLPVKPPKPGTSPTSVPATLELLMRLCAPKAATSQKFAQP